MSVFALRNPNAVFIGIPKTGSSTIREGIWKKDYEAFYGVGMPLKFARLILNEGWMSFAFVRHPFDRLVSAYSDFTQIRGLGLDIHQFCDIVMDEKTSFELVGPAERIRHHTLPQTHPAYALEYANWKLDFENFDAKVRAVCFLLKKQLDEIPQVKSTKHGHWRDVIPDDYLPDLANYYRQDFEELHYEP